MQTKKQISKLNILTSYKVVTNGVTDDVEIKGTLKFHYVDHVSPSQVQFYYNSRNKNVSLMLLSVNYNENKSSSDEEV